MKSFPFLMLTISASLLMTAMPAEARIKCWTNKDGVRECGERVPPEYSQKKHEVLNEQGLVIDEKDRARTEEEIAEERRQARIQAEQERIAAEKRREDDILLSTFSKVEDIEQARDDKIAALENSIGLAERRNEKIQQDLDKRVTQAAADERAGREPPQELLDDIEALRRQLETNDKFISDSRAEQEEVRESYARDIERFKKLTSASASAE